MLSYLQEKELSNLCLDTYNSINKIISNNPTFDTILPLLQNKIFIQNNHKIFNILGLDLNNKQIRSFLTCIMIKYCPDEIFSDKKELEIELMKHSDNLYNVYTDFLGDCLNENMHKQILEKLNTFTNIFDAWRNNDQKKLIIVLASSYHDLCLTLDHIKEGKYEGDEVGRAQEWMEEIEKQKKSLEKAIYKIGGEEAINKLQDGSYWLDLMTPEFKESIENNLKLAFFNKLRDEINCDKKPFMLLKCLQEIKDLLQKCIPSRDDIHSQWNRNIHFELLNQDINKETKTKIINDSLNKFKEIIMQLESPERNKDVCESEDAIENIKFCYEKIAMIFKDIQSLKDKLNKN